MDGLSKNSIRHEENSSRNSSAGSTTSERLKMVDITRDKPIKVAVRVSVPVRDHPKFNFVGKLLGPKGNSMKRLQEDTMCKMAVLGRGSMKDRKKEEELRLGGDPRYAHLSEELHVEISTFAAPAEAHARIAYALAEVRRFLVPDYHDDIRQEQMWEMQALTSSSSQTQTGEQNSPNDLSDAEMSTDNSKQLINDNSLSINLSNIAAVSTAAATATTHSTTNGLSDSDVNTHQSNFNNSLHVDLSPQHAVHPSAVAAAIHQQLAASAAAAGTGLIKPATGVAAVTGLTPNQAIIGIPSEAETNTPTLALVETPGALLHPALRGVKAVNIAGSLARKRPLLGVPRSSMNPTKRTVMTLLARAKNAQAVHAVRGTNTAGISEIFLNRPLQMITSPLIMSQPMDETMVAAQKENLLQGV